MGFCPKDLVVLFKGIGDSLKLNKDGAGPACVESDSAFVFRGRGSRAPGVASAGLL